MKYLSKINSPQDLKKLNENELEQLAKEIRKFLVKNVSKTGGHLASNLGVVELTIALHYVYNTPKDKIVFDVGHQSYVHKILTGRKDEFHTLRQLDGLSGFPKISESEHDSFDTGHSTTSISVAEGFSTARDIKGENYNVIAVIGDGAITGGQSFEAMNNIGRFKKKMVVILNDNEMSISENVGEVSKLLSKVRISKPYIDFKKGVYKKVNNKEKVAQILKGTKDRVKNIVMNGSVFEELGFTYVGPIDGHDIEALISAFNHIKNIDNPVLLHVHTKKGAGYKPAEMNPSKFHGIAPFDIKTGEIIKKSNKSYSEVVGDKFLSLAKQNEKLVFISAAMISGTGLDKVYKNFRNRTIDVGICEPHAVTFAAALAKEGLIPVFCVYSTFLQRAYDQIIHDVCIENLHVIFMIDRAGIVGEDGETHQGVFDISFLSHIPNMTILAPKDEYELEQMIDFAVSLNSPVAIRYPRGEAKVYELEKNEIKPFESETVFEGEEILIVAVGKMFDLALDVCEMLKQNGKNPTLINARFLKPIDEKIATISLNYKIVVTIEDNVLKGGFSENLLPILYKNGYRGEFLPIGYDDKFIPQGKVDELLERMNITKENILNQIMSKI